MERPKQLFADDLIVGLSFRGETNTLSLDHFSGFAQLTGDKHPIHYDSAFAATTKFGRPLAHGLLLTAFTALGATAFSESLEDGMIALVEQQMKFLHPAFVGDVLTPEFTVTSNKPSSNGRTAVVELTIVLVNQAGEQILKGRHTYLLRRGPQSQ
jgi:acyl dehydratase